MTITEQLTELKTLESTLASNLTDKGVDASAGEGFKNLIGKVQDISAGGVLTLIKSGSDFVGGGSLTISDADGDLFIINSNGGGNFAIGIRVNGELLASHSNVYSVTATSSTWIVASSESTKRFSQYYIYSIS